MSEITNKPYLKLENIYKRFGNTQALAQMNLMVFRGEVLGIVGPNGAGKSTLMKIIMGVYTPDKGTFCIENEQQQAALYHVQSAKNMGIECAYQELSLCTNLTAYENLLISYRGVSLSKGFGWRKRAAEYTRKRLEEVFPGSGIDVSVPVRELPLAQRQMIEITKAVSSDNLKVLILDEPTSSLTTDRIVQLHDYIRKLSARGIAILYISHKLTEISQICDRVCVLKSGHCIDEVAKGCASEKDLVELMGGGISNSIYSRDHKHGTEEVLRISNLSTSQLHGINIHGNRGEIIGISGIAGSGQKALLDAILQAHGSTGKCIQVKSEVCYASGDRKNEGIFTQWDIGENILISSLKKVSGRFLIHRRRHDAAAQHWYEKLKFAANGIHDDITSLSGGNQQKALIARALATDADIILLNDPTCGVDIETKYVIYQLLQEARDAGRCVILHSTEDQEMEQCDRVYVMSEGHIVKELIDDEINVANIVEASFIIPEHKTEPSVGASALARKSKKIFLRRETIPVIVFLLILGISILMNPNIASYTGLNMLMNSAIPLVLISLSQMFIIISEGVDMGNGYAVGLINMVIAFYWKDHPLLAALLLILFVAAYGMMGAMIHATRIPAIVVTLGASYVWRGLALMIADVPGGSCPAWMRAFFKFKMPVVPMSIVIIVVVTVLVYCIVKRSRYGMIINGSGNNAVAVTRAGWSKLWATVATYALSGALLVLAGMSITVNSAGGDANGSSSYQMLSIASIIIGGCEFSGGFSSPVGVTFGALAVSNISVLLTMLNINSNLQNAFTGLTLICALIVKLFVTRKEEKV